MINILVAQKVTGELRIRTPNIPPNNGETAAEYYARLGKQKDEADYTFVAAILSTDLPNADGAITIEEYFYDTGVVVKRPSPDQVRAFRNSWRWDGADVIVDPVLEIAERNERNRVIRNTLLFDADGPTAREIEQNGPKKQAWINYKQGLRDVPSQSDPKNITWPTAP